MQVTINYDPHNADDMAKLTEMFSSTITVAAKPQTGEAAETKQGKPAIDFKKRLRAEAEAERLRAETEAYTKENEERSTHGNEEAKLTERQKAEAEENTESDPVDLNTVKSLAIEAIKAGKRDEVLAKLKELGSPTVTKLPAKHFGEMHQYLTELMEGV